MSAQAEAHRVSLSQQAEAVECALRRQETIAQGGTVRGLRGKSAEVYDQQRLEAALRTMRWLQANHAALAAFLALPAEARAAALAHGQSLAVPSQGVSS